ncbi:hypothetical protein FK514_27495, partial [Klebsiella pneumoniae]|nr:hypothetical protein [Klebsiella pneumoniae]
QRGVVLSMELQQRLIEDGQAAGEWLHSVTTPHELLPLLGRIFHVALASAENSPAL